MSAQNVDSTESAMYVEIKRFAVHDGPGVRTTLFLKGCSLACRWCHNPETIHPRPELLFHKMKCTSCGRCSAVCPNHQISGGEHSIDRQKCTSCGKCTAVCPSGALETAGKKISVREAADLLLADSIFYSPSGGVTLSGGEPLLQSKFCAALFSCLKEKEHIHCAIDTAGNVPWSCFEDVLPVTDLFLYDFKIADSGLHREYTGCGNRLILDNLTRLSQCGKAIEIRIPLIPGINLTEKNLHETGAFLAPLKAANRVRLLAFHSMAHSKFQAAGHEDTLPQTASPTAAEIKFAAEILDSYGLETIVPDII